MKDHIVTIVALVAELGNTDASTQHAKAHHTWCQEFLVMKLRNHQTI